MADEEEIAALKARLATLEGQAGPPPSPPPGQPAMTQAQAQGCLWLVVLAGIAVLAGVSMCSRPRPDPAQAAREAEDAALISEARAAVRARARDPDSVRFGAVVVSRQSGAAVVCGEFNARNGFGGYAGDKRFLVAQGSGQAVTEGDGGEGVFALLWSRFCPAV